jgi:hypothetical protein
MTTAFIDPDRVKLAHAGELPAPVFVLAPSRSYTSIVCAMIGQHPQMYALPETNLLCHETVGDKLEQARHSTHRSTAHGLIRLVGQLYFGAQNEQTVVAARAWLRARSAFTTELLFRSFSDTLFPRVLIEKSPSNVNRVRCLERMHTKFPGGRYIHLVRHPRGHGESVIKAIKHESARQPLPPTHWLLQVATYRPDQPSDNGSAAESVLDPQHWWYARNRTIMEFLRSVPAEQQIRVRGEDVLGEPDETLGAIAAWLGLRTDRAAVEMMKHPERSPYAFIGPPGAKFGNDEFFLRDPALRVDRLSSHSLNGPLDWRGDGEGFRPEVKVLAVKLGYT